MKTLSSLLTNSSENKYTLDDLMEKRKKDSVLISEKIDNERKGNYIKFLFGRSGITPLYENCTINNFIVETPDQQLAKDFAYNYIVNFKREQKSFIFAGTTGTGKNHLASAICNNLIVKGKSCLITTVEELMINSRKTYGKNAKCSESEFIKTMINIDLLILDEIGLQRNNDNEKIMLNQIIDKRVSNLKPTGMLTNFELKQVKKSLGLRVFSRMKSSWIAFNWEDYRGKNNV